MLSFEMQQALVQERTSLRRAEAATRRLARSARRQQRRHAA